MGEKPYWVGQFYPLRFGWEHCIKHWEVGGRSTMWIPDANCRVCKWAAEMNEKKGLMVPPTGWKQEVMKDTNVAPEGGAKYSFMGRPDFGRIIRENEGADVIIVSREDGLVCFLFNVGESNTTPGRNDALEMACLKVGAHFLWGTRHEGSRQTLPAGWVLHTTDDHESLKNLRKVAQLFVRARTGKHTVEVLP